MYVFAHSMVCSEDVLMDFIFKLLGLNLLSHFTSSFCILANLPEYGKKTKATQEWIFPPTPVYLCVHYKYSKYKILSVRKNEISDARYELKYYDGNVLEVHCQSVIFLF